MKNMLTFLFLWSSFIGWGQEKMENNPILKEGNIKTSYIKITDGSSNPEYKLLSKKSCSIENVVKVNDDVVTLIFKCNDYSKLGKSGQSFKVAGAKNEDGTFDNVYAYYSNRADIWAIPYKGSIYFINSSIRKCTSEEQLNIQLIMGEEQVDRLELFNYYKTIHAVFNNEPFTPKEITLSVPEMMNKYSINKAEIESTKLNITKCDHQKNCVLISVYNEYAGGYVWNSLDEKRKSKYLMSEYDFVFSDPAIKEGWKPLNSEWNLYDIEIGKYFVFDKYNSNETGPDKMDGLIIKAINNSTGEIITEMKYLYDYIEDSVFLDFSGNIYQKKKRYYKGFSGAEIDLHISETTHTETSEKLHLYTLDITDPEGNKSTKYVKVNPDSHVIIDYSGGKGRDDEESGSEGGEPGSFNLVVDSKITNYNLVHFGKKGEQGNVYGHSSSYSSSNESSSSPNSSSSNSASSPSEIIIINNTGKGVCIVQGGRSKSIGKKETYDCDDDIYYGVMNGNNCSSTKGAKIADANSQCGNTITLD